MSVVVLTERFGYIVGMKIGNLNLPGQVLLAPLAGVSNRPFRVLAVRGGATMTFTEMVSSEAIIRLQEPTYAMMNFKNDEQPIGIQLFGADPEVMNRAAQITVERFGPQAIDINFGCPVKKVVSKNGGAAVLKDLSLTEDIIRAVVEGSGSTPVMVKMRTGWDDCSPVFCQVGRIAEKVGAKAVTLHARSRASGYSGKADWEAIKQLKQSVGNIAVIGNGDIMSPKDAKQVLDETVCDGIMIGRAALGNPFIFSQMRAYLERGEEIGEPGPLEKIDMARLHAQLQAEEFGEVRGMRMMRRYLGWYVKGFVGANELRARLMHVETVGQVDAILAAYVRDYLGREPSPPPVTASQLRLSAEN
jgi:tRNA-dihydrouridine synthase B